MSGVGRRETAAPPRLFGLDAARGVALLGMFVAHTVVARGELVVDGRSAILFATVAGVSLGLMTGGASPPPRGARGAARRVVLVRGGVLVVLGLVLTVFVEPPIAVILDYYGFAFLLLVGVLFGRRLFLAVGAGIVAFAAPPIVSLVTDGTAFDAVPGPLQLFARWLFHGEYPMLVWLAFLLIGLVLARSDLGDRFTAALAAVGGSLAAILGYASVLVIPGTSAAAHTGSTAEVVGSGGVAVAIIGILSLLDSASGAGERFARPARILLAPLAAAGSMPLTLYSAHAIVLAIVERATVSDGRWQVPGWLLPTLIVGALVVATVWRRLIGPGPLEAGLRALTRVVVPGRDRSRVGP